MEMRSYAPAWLLLLAGATALAVVAAALEAQSTHAYSGAFAAWLKEYRPATAIAVVRRQHETVLLDGHGADPRAPSLISSMSKPITGACVGTLIRDGKLAFTTPLREALAGFFRRHGPPADSRLEDATIEQLLTHRSGLRGTDEHDPIQDIWRRRLEDGLADEASPEPLLVELFRYRLAYDPGTRQTYSNGGFVTLAAVVEEASGRSYENYCRAAVFDRLGIASARLHPDWRQFSGARGWFITGADYLTFLEVFDPSNPFFGDAVKAWIVSAQTKWTPGNRAHFDGLGIPTTIYPEGWYVVHSGIMDFHGKNRRGRPIAAVVQSHAYRDQTGFAAFYAMTPAWEGNPALGKLDDAISRIREQLQKSR
jgi:CubicO group peptidase (beta-lactamase class C family)